jgi:phosphoribosyl-ATP pyrophosphohydrolase
MIEAEIGRMASSRRGLTLALTARDDDSDPGSVVDQLQGERKIARKVGFSADHVTLASKSGPWRKVIDTAAPDPGCVKTRTVL